MAQGDAPPPASGACVVYTCIGYHRAALSLSFFSSMMSDALCGTRRYVRVPCSIWLSVSGWDSVHLVFLLEEWQCVGSKGRRELPVMMALVR